MIKKGDSVRIIEHQYVPDIRNDILLDEIGKVTDIDENLSIPVEVKFKCGYEVFHFHELEVVVD